MTNTHILTALTAAIDAPDAEPVAWIGDSPTKGNGRRLFWSRSEAYRYASNITPLYTHSPAVREPLTRQALKAVIASVPEPDDDHVGKWVVAVCRAVEAAHGIGVKPWPTPKSSPPSNK